MVEKIKYVIVTFYITFIRRKEEARGEEREEETDRDRQRQTESCYISGGIQDREPWVPKSEYSGPDSGGH